MINDEIRDELSHLKDSGYRALQCRILPSVPPDSIIGVRTPQLRTLAKQMAKRKDVQDFLNDLPHPFFEENQLHSFIISGMKDFHECLDAVTRFLPYIDNWATCDQLSPKTFRKHRKELLPHIRQWIGSGATYSVRFGIGMLMEHFLGDDFDPSYPAMVANVRSGEYYVRMMMAWYFATALAKQYESAIPYIEQRRLDVWTHNKTIQKAIESYRVTEERKEYLRSLKRREPSNPG